MKHSLYIISVIIFVYGNVSWIGTSEKSENKIVSFDEKSRNKLFESVKKIIDKAPELSKLSDSTYLLSKENFLLINDSIFIKEVFFPNLGLYFENETEINEDFSLNGTAEYHILPPVVYKKNKPSVHIIGKITKTNFTTLLVRYYDIDAVRCYLITFDNDFNIKSSVCLFAYHTIDPDDVYLSKDKLYFPPFIYYERHEDSLKIHTKGFVNINYLFEIQYDGKINLVNKEQLDEE